MAVHGTRRRDSVSWDHAGLLKLLAGLARDRTGLPVLRCYWYETADGGRTAEHDALAEMPGLKLRLVNTRPGRREGIESQLRRDIVTLAKSGAIADAFIASADEHLAEIVAEVQDLGLRVVVLHIASDGGWTIPQPLRQECDDIVEISAVHLRPFVDLIRGAEPVAPEEQYAAGGYGSRSRADGDRSMAAATSQSGLPAQSLPAALGGYQASGGSDYGSAQPYANSGSAAHGADAASNRSSAPEQALMAVRSPEPDSVSGQFPAGQFGGRAQDGTGAQVNASGHATRPQFGGLPEAGGQQSAMQAAGVSGPQHAAHGGEPYGAYSSGASQQAGSGQHAAPDWNVAQHGSPGQAQHASPGQAQHASPAHAQHALPGQGRDMNEGAAQHYGQHAAGGQRAGQSGAPQHAAQGRAAQHPAHAALEALERGAHAPAQPPGNEQQGNAVGGVPAGGGIGAGAFGGGSGEGSAQGTGYPDSVSTGTHARSGRYRSGSILNGGFQAGGFQGGSFQNDPAQAGPAQAGPAHAGPAQTGPPQPGAGQPGAGAPRDAYLDSGQTEGYPGAHGATLHEQTSTVHHLSGLSFPAGTASSVPNGISGGTSGNGEPATTDHQVGYPNESGQNGTGVHASPGYQNGSMQNAPGQYGSFGGYQPGGAHNGSQFNSGLLSGEPANPAGYGAPVNGDGPRARPNVSPAGFEAAPVAAQPSPYRPIDPGYFPGQAGAGGAGQMAQHPGSQPSAGTHARDAYGPARDAYAPARDGYGAAQAAGPSLPPRATHQAPPHQAQPQVLSQSPQPASPLPAVRPAQPVAISLTEAVKAAHGEGFAFGESVGRDAPGLWLEAVLARKPRMPSDLEARLLQGSVLPIDSLLHDEVRHSLRRGFWEALESARR
ncbi:MAG: hypothetical protein ACTHJW_13320 [Streptosporangiaceae bacterium]